jgi:hypothetical protein
MAHPKETKRVGHTVWHLEDSKLSYNAARALKTHLVNTEGKKARITKAKDGWRVWWAR